MTLHAGPPCAWRPPPPRTAPLRPRPSRWWKCSRAAQSRHCFSRRQSGRFRRSAACSYAALHVGQALCIANSFQACRLRVDMTVSQFAAGLCFCSLGCLVQLRSCILANIFQAAMARRVPCDPALPGCALAASLCFLIESKACTSLLSCSMMRVMRRVKMVDADTVHSSAMGPLQKYAGIVFQSNECSGILDCVEHASSKELLD